MRIAICDTDKKTANELKHTLYSYINKNTCEYMNVDISLYRSKIL